MLGQETTWTRRQDTFQACDQAGLRRQLDMFAAHWNPPLEWRLLEILSSAPCNEEGYGGRFTVSYETRPSPTAATTSPAPAPAPQPAPTTTAVAPAPTYQQQSMTAPGTQNETAGSFQNRLQSQYPGVHVLSVQLLGPANSEELQIQVYGSYNPGRVSPAMPYLWRVVYEYPSNIEPFGGLTAQQQAVAPPPAPTTPPLPQETQADIISMVAMGENVVGREFQMQSQALGGYFVADGQQVYWRMVRAGVAQVVELRPIPAPTVTTMPAPTLEPTPQPVALPVPAPEPEPAASAESTAYSYPSERGPWRIVSSDDQAAAAATASEPSWFQQEWIPGVPNWLLGIGVVVGGYYLMQEQNK